VADNLVRLKKETGYGQFFWMAMALIAGGLLPFLGAFNARLGVAIASPLIASMISFLVGTLVIASYLLVTRPNVAWAGASGAPWYAWLGGFCGAFSLTMLILTYPKLGPGLGFGLLIAGQLLLSVILEHFNFLVVEPRPISILRLAGVAFVLAGVAMIRIF
jgi:bacterial/archaeal transporter family-2 protein